MVAPSSEPIADREIVVKRTFQAPGELVWQAWTTPEHVAAWWGPDGFTNTIHEMNVTPGGVWRLTMHGPDGTDYPNRIVFHEVVRPSRLVYEHIDDDGTAHFQATVTFDEQDGGTAVTLQMLFPTKAARDMTIEKYGALEGAKQTLARLEQHLTTMDRSSM